MTNQEIFDKVSTHLLTTLTKSVNENGDCLYRGPNGTMCAVGCLIPDEMYDPKMDNIGDDGDNYTSIDVIYANFPELHTLFDAEQLDLLFALQTIHDDMLREPDNGRYVYATWKEELRKVARNFDLDTTVLDTIKRPK